VEPHFFAGLLKPLFWLAVVIPALAGLRWALNRYVRPRLKASTWDLTQAPVGDVGAALAILAAIIVGGLLVTT
jgi:hypothetical protein